MKHITVDDYTQYKDIMLAAHTNANIIYVHKDHVCVFEKNKNVEDIYVKKIYGVQKI